LDNQEKDGQHDGGGDDETSHRGTPRLLEVDKVEALVPIA
jgi:hypothetical protein